MSKITNMHVVSDDKTLLHTTQLRPVALGTVETMYGVKYRVIDNWSTTIVTYEPVGEMHKADVLTAVNTLLTQTNNGYHLGRVDIEQAERAIALLQHLLVKAKKEQA